MPLLRSRTNRKKKRCARYTHSFTLATRVDYYGRSLKLDHTDSPKWRRQQRSDPKVLASVRSIWPPTLGYYWPCCWFIFIVCCRYFFWVLATIAINGTSKLFPPPYDNASWHMFIRGSVVPSVISHCNSTIFLVCASWLSMRPHFHTYTLFLTD